MVPSRFGYLAVIASSDRLPDSLTALLLFEKSASVLGTQRRSSADTNVSTVGRQTRLHTASHRRLTGARIIRVAEKDFREPGSAATPLARTLLRISARSAFFAVAFVATATGDSTAHAKRPIRLPKVTQR